MKIKDHIKNEFSGVNAAFARSEGVQPAQITQWEKKGFIVIDGTLYSPRRKLKGPDQ